jgi:exopolyphosphatase/guanosine-5'-triphosphate,3'-diphosphate pyrophosphatase
VEPGAPRPAVAAVDCGTNSTRLLIVSAARPVERLMRITRLGQGVDESGRLQPSAIARTLAVLAEYRQRMDVHRVARARLVATSAVRDARNGEEFLALASATIGVRAELLDGETEGALAFAGATSVLGLDPTDAVVVDIGGGSTELVVGGPQTRAVSLELGCVRLTERFFAHDPPTHAELEAAARYVDAQLEVAAEKLPELADRGRVLVGLAGTVSTLGALSQGLTHYERDRIHGTRLSQADVRLWCDRLAAERSRQRAQRPGLSPGREDVIVGGVVVLREVMERFGFEYCTVSEADLLDGIAATLESA